MNKMEGFGFVASLHAATLDPRGSNTLLLKPTKRQSRSSSSGSISGKAKCFINRSRSFLSTGSSSSSSSGTRTSLSLSSFKGTEHGHRKRPNSTWLDGQSVFTSSTSSRIASGDYKRSSQTSRTSFQHSNSHHIQSPQWHREESRPSTQLEETWISNLVDNGYVSPPKSTPPRLPPSSEHDNAEFNPDMEPSRASSMLDRDLVSLSSFEDSHQLPQPELPPLLSHSIAQQLMTNSLDENKPDTHWLADCENLLRFESIPHTSQRQRKG